MAEKKGAEGMNKSGIVKWTDGKYSMVEVYKGREWPFKNEDLNSTRKKAVLMLPPEPPSEPTPTTTEGVVHAE